MTRATHPVIPDSGLPERIAGYRVDQYVGQGSMAAVYLAHDERMRRDVALKVLAPELACDAGLSRQVIRDSQAVAAVSHPHLLPVYEAGQEGGTVYVAMRYAPGGSARSLVGRFGPLPLGYAWQIIAHIASALDAVHVHGLLHRDVRPANILLDPGDPSGDNPPGGRPYLADFGMSRQLSAEHLIATGQYTGTLDYAAPERIDAHPLDRRADLYSLACSGFELLCGTPPFGHDQGMTVMYAHLYAPPPAASAVRADLPAAADQVLATALAKNPADRYPSCAEFAEELRAALGLRPVAPGHPASGPGPRAAAAEKEPYGLEAIGLPGAGEATGPPTREPGRPHRPGSRVGMLKLILVTAGVLVLAAPVVFGLARSRSSGTAAPAPSATSRPASPSASGQAAAVSALLASSAATRTALNDDVRQAAACTDLPGAVGRLQDVVSRRAAESRQAAAMLTTAVPNGAALKSDLIAALNSSLASDRAFLTWALQLQDRGCGAGGQSTAYGAAVSASQRADAAKLTLVQVWDPLAARYGISQVSPASI